MEKKATILSAENMRTCTINGETVRSRGIEIFRTNCGSSSTANIDFFASKQLVESRWQKCEMGCHGPQYRVLYRDTNYSEVMDTLEKLDPTQGLATGVIDGAATTTHRVIKGVQRTGEGLGLAGGQRIGEIGIENSTAFKLAKEALVQGFSWSLSVVNNPFTALIIKILTHYMRFMPNEIIVELAIHGKLKFVNADIDVRLVVQASIKGLTDIDLSDAAIAELNDIASSLKNNPQLINRFVGKQIGKRLATHIATLVAIAIAKQVAAGLARTIRYTNILKHSRSGKSTKGLAEVLVFLLKTQGMLQVASEASGRLFGRSPLLWQSLRQMNGLDMIYFFVEDFLSEHVDRIGFGEKHPTQFIEMVVAILEPPGTAKDLFFPFADK